MRQTQIYDPKLNYAVHKYLMVTNPHESLRLLAGLGEDVSEICVVGANGWFGITTLNLLNNIGFKMEKVTAIVRHKPADNLWPAAQIRVVSFNEIEKYRVAGNSMIINCTGMNRHQIKSMGAFTYLHKTKMLRESIQLFLLQNSESPSIHFSSGARIKFENTQDLYAQDKILFENMLDSIKKSVKCIVTARVWSVSGGYLNDPEQYMFSSFVKKAIQNQKIEIQNLNTFRKYVGIDEVIALTLRQASSSQSILFDTTGILTDPLNLAKELDCTYSVARNSPQITDSYYSESKVMLDLFHKYDYSPMDIKGQIDVVKKLFISRGFMHAKL